MDVKKPMAEADTDGGGKKVYQLDVRRNAQSKFTWKQFLDLKNPEKSHNTPLAVIAHVDVNAFFAQAEQLRLGLSASDPVVCVQWSSLIAVSYAARKFGINRMDSIESARRKCPNVIAAHTAVFKKGEPNWTYHEAGVLPNSETHKVSLDPYRRESRKMMRLFRSQCDKVEKASVDESFMDFGRLIYARAVELFPELQNAPKDLEDHLPGIPEVLPEDCKFQGEVIHNDDPEETKDGDVRLIQDWDDLFILLGSMMAFDIRKLIESELGYTTSCGVSRVKTISKLASGFIKPDAQTVVRASAIANFCDNFEISDFWSMGGKIGNMIQAKLSTPSEGSVRYIRDHFSQNELLSRLQPDTASANQLYKMVRGELYTPLNLRTDIKSMGSTKNFRGKTVSSLNDIIDWMPVFCGDILQRMVELDEESGILSGDTSKRIIRRPKTVNIHFRTSEFQSFSRQCSLPLLASLDKIHDLIFSNGCKLYETAVASWNELAHGKLFPLSNFGIGVTNFEEMDFTRSIDDFAAKGSDNTDVIRSMFAELSESKKSQPVATPPIVKSASRPTMLDKYVSAPESKDDTPTDPNYCPKCLRVIVDEDMSSHKDYHYALQLSREFATPEAPEAPEPPRQSSPHTSSSRKKKRKLEKGQSTLPFLK